MAGGRYITLRLNIYRHHECTDLHYISIIHTTSSCAEVILICILLICIQIISFEFPTNTALYLIMNADISTMVSQVACISHGVL